MQDLHSVYPEKNLCPDLLRLFDHGFEQAQTSVSQLLHRPIFFYTQSAELCTWSQVQQNLLDPHSIAVIQPFDGDYQGVVSLTLPKKLWLQSRTQDKEDNLLFDKNQFDFNDDLLNEASNIMINSLLRSLSVLMVQRFSSGLPQQPSKKSLTRFFSETGFNASKAFVMQINVCYEKHAISALVSRPIVLCLHMKSDSLLDSWHARLMSLISSAAV